MWGLLSKISCEYFNGKTCDNYISRFDACKEYPFFELNNDSGLMLVCECNFQINWLRWF